MIEVSGLTKNFKVHKKEAGFLASVTSLFKRDYIIKSALDNLDLRVESGEIIGLIGANGAGKTTLTKILSGIIHPTNGSVLVNGFNPWDRNNEYRKKMAVIMGQKAQLWWDLPAMDGFLLLKDIYQIPTKDFQNNIEYLAEYLAIKDQLNIQVRKLSLGERMKVELMAALIHSPKVIFLDEPTIGLDISAQKSVRSFLKKYQKEHKPTMILTSHYMDDIEELCKRIVILRNGSKVFDGEIATLHQEYSFNKIITAHSKDQNQLQSVISSFPSELGTVEKIKNGIKVMAPKEKMAKTASFLLSKCELTDLNIQNEEISDLIEKIMIEGKL